MCPSISSSLPSWEDLKIATVMAPRTHGGFLYHTRSPVHFNGDIPRIEHHATQNRTTSILNTNHYGTTTASLRGKPSSGKKEELLMLSGQAILFKCAVYTRLNTVIYSIFVALPLFLLGAPQKLNAATEYGLQMLMVATTLHLIPGGGSTPWAGYQHKTVVANLDRHSRILYSSETSGLIIAAHAPLSSQSIQEDVDFARCHAPNSHVSLLQG
ncbi:hypothetical protein EV426DRAFT_574416 [Tirmania nivea]|nr:hypothetical protein EV426DRAFT_574416 [Tirmania nivea]